MTGRFADSDLVSCVAARPLDIEVEIQYHRLIIVYCTPTHCFPSYPQCCQITNLYTSSSPLFLSLSLFLTHIMSMSVSFSPSPPHLTCGSEAFTAGECDNPTAAKQRGGGLGLGVRTTERLTSTQTSHAAAVWLPA